MFIRVMEKVRVGRSVLTNDVGYDYMWKIDSTLTCSTYVAMNTISTMIQFTLHSTEIYSSSRLTRRR